MRHVTVVTTSRADYGIYGPILRQIKLDPDLSLDVMVTGSHLVPAFGHSIRQIESDGYPVRDRIECLLANDSPWGISQAMALTILGFSQSFAAHRPELLLLLGDRYEMFAAASAAVPFNLPLAHVHGGEVTEGAMDEAFRHSITKMSHIHFASTEEYRRRIIQLGESPERVHTTGAPSLDNLNDVELLTAQAMSQRLGISLDVPPLLVTFHPVTLEYEQTPAQINALLAALESETCPIVFTYPNADTNGRVIIEAIDKFVARHPSAVVAQALGTQGYFSLMRLAKMMIGNSSSGIIEAASFKLPVVNIGIRQRGRARGANVLDCAPAEESIRQCMAHAGSAEFRSSLAGLANPYGDGNAAAKIVAQLKSLQIDDRLLRKSFFDLPVA